MEEGEEEENLIDNYQDPFIQAKLEENSTDNYQDPFIQAKEENFYPNNETLNLNLF